MVIIKKLKIRRGSRGSGVAIRVAGGIAVGVACGTAVRVNGGAAVRVAGGAAIEVTGGAAVRVASSAAVRVASGIGKVAGGRAGDIVSLFKVKLSWSYRAIVIISLILIRAKPISLFIHL